MISSGLGWRDVHIRMICHRATSTTNWLHVLSFHKKVQVIALVDSQFFVAVDETFLKSNWIRLLHRSVKIAQKITPHAHISWWEQTTAFRKDRTIRQWALMILEYPPRLVLSSTFGLRQSWVANRTDSKVKKRNRGGHWPFYHICRCGLETMEFVY